MKTPLVPALAFVAATLAAACGDPQTQYQVRYADDFPRAPLKLSLFGVFKDGRMSAESWDQLAPTLSPAFGAKSCAVAYDEALLAKAPETATAIDDVTRANGVTEDFLDAFATKAEGDAIVLVTIAGHPPQPIGEPHGGSQGGPSPAAMPMYGRGTRGPRGMGGMPASDRVPGTDNNVFLVSAQIFSVKAHRTLAEIGMTYSGKSVDEAMSNFRQKLATELHGSTCVGWKPEVEIDQAKIRAVAE